VATELRKTGISVVGDVPWGTHFCHFYETKQDLLDTLVPYFKAGLESNEFCLWVVSNPDLITLEDAKEALARAVPDLDRRLSDGNIEILNGLDWYLEKDALNLETVTRAWDAKLKQALARGYDGMRVSGDTYWLRAKDRKDFGACEKQLNDSINDQPMTVLCTYPLAKSGAAELLDLAKTHQFAIARRRGEWEVIESPELIQAKGEIKRLNEELEQGVIERTNELRVANEALRNEIAQRQRAEALLHAREQEFRAIVENAPDHIIRYDRNFRRTYVNPAVARDYGLPAEALAGKPIGSVVQDASLDVTEDALAQVRQRIADVFDTGKSYEYELTWPMPAGLTYFSVRLFPELDLNGSVVNVLGISRDITERRRAEEELKKEKEILEKIFDNIPVMIGFVGDDGIKLVNPEWERTIGWTLKELQEQNVDIFAEAYPDLTYRQEVLDFVAASTGEWVDLKIKVRDGQVIDAACAVVHLSDGTKIAIAQDITERKQAEAALDERFRFETLLSELSAAFANLSPNEVDREIDKWLQTLAEFLSVDRASFLQFGEDLTALYRSHSYTVPGIEPLPPSPLGMKDQFPWITDQLRRGITVKWSRIPDDMPEEAVKEKEYAAKLGVKSGLNIPVLVGGSVICAIAFTSIVTYRDWPDAMVARLRLVGEIFASAAERKRAEAALRESEERFRQMAENIREVFWMCTADLSETLYISPAYEVVWGRSCESLYRDLRSVFTAIHPDDRTRAVTIIESGLEQGFEVEYRVVRPDGSIRWVWDRGFPIRDESGRCYRLAGIAEDITERKQAEDALRLSEDHLRLTIDTIPTMAWSLRPDGVLDFLNQRWIDYTGLSLEQYLEEPTRPVHPEDISRVMEKWLGDKAAGKPNEDEIRLRRADGEYRWFLVRNAPLRDEQGNIVKWYGVSIDIEDRKRAEEKLKQSESQLAGAQRLAHVGSWDWEIRSNAVTWSDELYRIFGLEPGKINVAGDATVLIHPEDRDFVSSTVHGAVKSKEPYSFHYRILRPNGEERIVHSRGHVLSDEQGEPLRVFGATQDVTERKQAEEALSEAEQKYRDMFEHAGEGIFQTTPEGRYIAANPALARMYRFASPEELIHSRQDISLQVYCDPNGREEFKRQLEEHGAVRGFEHEVFRKDGSRFWISVNARAVRDEHGAIQYYEGTAQDINERKAAEEKLKATSGQLRALSARLQLVREEEATRIAREIHDELGSVLTRLKWDLELLSKERLETKDKADREQLGHKIDEMIQLVEATIDTVRRISAELRPSALDDLGLAAALRLQAEQFQDRTGILTDCDCAVEDLGLNQRQSTAVFRVFEEALTNIMRHAEATRVDVRLEKDNLKIMLTIRDNGRGITEADILDPSSLGLLGMRERIQLIEGEINITGIEGRGTLVTIRLPNPRKP
jgi:PAS domain S-box-containing protein